VMNASNPTPPTMLVGITDGRALGRTMEDWETPQRRMLRSQLHQSNKPCCNGWDKYLASEEFQPLWVCNSPSSDASSGDVERQLDAAEGIYMIHDGTDPGLSIDVGKAHLNGW